MIVLDSSFQHAAYRVGEPMLWLSSGEGVSVPSAADWSRQSEEKNIKNKGDPSSLRGFLSKRLVWPEKRGEFVSEDAPSNRGCVEASSFREFCVLLVASM